MRKKHIPVFFLILVAFGMESSAQEPVTDREKAAAGAVARFVETDAQQNGLHKLKRMEDEYLRKDACYRAAGNKDVVPISVKFGTVSVFRYSSPDLTLPPLGMQEWMKHLDPLGTENARRFAVGICRDQSDEHQQYQIDVGLYYGPVRTFFAHFVAD